MQTRTPEPHLIFCDICKKQCYAQSARRKYCDECSKKREKERNKGYSKAYKDKERTKRINVNTEGKPTHEVVKVPPGCDYRVGARFSNDFYSTLHMGYFQDGMVIRNASGQLLEVRGTVTVMIDEVC
jgi:hypothetical protein